MAITGIVGFDSAWTDNPKAPGAICALLLDDVGPSRFVEPRLATFEQALDFIFHVRGMCSVCLVAIDQPTIVPNAAGSRPVDKVAGSLISWVGGGVQPADRSKASMFGDTAPIWRFKDRLSASEDPEAARTATSGLHIAEVFPALALVSLEEMFCDRLKGPRYNPSNRKKFRLPDWQRVLDAVRRYARGNDLGGVDDWIATHARIDVPRKADQDRLDAVLCAVVGHHWRVQSRSQSIMIGDLATGYMIAPASATARARLEAAAARRIVSVDGRIP